MLFLVGIDKQWTRCRFVTGLTSGRTGAVLAPLGLRCDLLAQILVVPSLLLFYQRSLLTTLVILPQLYTVTLYSPPLLLLPPPQSYIVLES